MDNPLLRAKDFQLAGYLEDLILAMARALDLPMDILDMGLLLRCTMEVADKTKGLILSPNHRDI